MLLKESFSIHFHIHSIFMFKFMFMSQKQSTKKFKNYLKLDFMRLYVDFLKSS